MASDPVSRHRTLAGRARSTSTALVTHPWAIWASAVLAPVATALILVLARGHLSAANHALIFVVVTVAIASSGNRGAAALAALVSAASFDFFLTRPYQSFRIRDQADLTTELLFVLVGLLVGDLAARGRRYRTVAIEGRHGLDRIHGVGEQIVGGEDPEFVLMNVATQPRELCPFRIAASSVIHPRAKGHGSRLMERCG